MLQNHPILLSVSKLLNLIKFINIYTIKLVLFDSLCMLHLLTKPKWPIYFRNEVCLLYLSLLDLDPSNADDYSSPYSSLVRLVQEPLWCIWAGQPQKVKWNRKKACKMLCPPFSNKLDLFVLSSNETDKIKRLSACAHSLDLFFSWIGKPRQRHLVTCLFNCPECWIHSSAS